MEILTTIAVFWFAGVLTAVYSLYYPAWRFVRDAKPKNIFVRRKFLALFVVFLIFSLTLPFLTVTMFSDDLSERFKKGFAKGMLGIPNDGIQ
jgi:hypothetical protein